MASDRAAWTPRALVIADRDGALRVPDAAMQELRALRACHLHVLGLLGPPHTGKRVLLRALLRAPSLEAAASQDAQVEADERVLLWMWREDGTEHGAKAGKDDATRARLVLAADAGGADGSDATRRQATALLLLLSSVVLYNEDGEVDEAALGRLAWMQQVAASLRIAPNQDDDAVTRDFAQHAPLFVWLIRNCKIKWLTTAAGDKATEQEYLEQRLAEEPGFSEAVTARNTARMYLRALFSKRDCVSLPRAVDAPTAGATPSTEKLREQFVTAVDKLFTSRVSEKAAVQNHFPVKQILGRELQSQHFAVVLESYVNAFNSGGLPTIQLASNAIFQTNAEEAFTTARGLYDDATSVFRATSEQEVNASSSRMLWMAHLRGLQDAVNHLRRVETTLPTKLRACFAERRVAFEKETEKQLKTAREANLQRSAAACQKVLTQIMPQGSVEALISSLEARRRQSFPDGMATTMMQYKTDLHVAIDNYNANSAGPASYEVLEKTLLTSVRAFTSQWGPSILHRYQQHLQSLQAQKAQLDQELEVANAQDSSATFSTQDHKRLYEDQLAQATQQLTELRRVLQGELNDKKSELDRLMGDIVVMDGKHEAQMKAVECDLAWVRSRSLELEKAAREERQRLEYDVSGASLDIEAKERSFQEEEHALMTQHKDLMARVVELERQLVEKKTIHIQQVFRVEAETSHQLSALHHDQNDFTRQLKQQVKTDKGVLRLSFQKTKMAVQAELERVEREIKENQDKLAILEPRATTTRPGASVSVSKSAGRPSIASTLSSRMSSFQLFPLSPRQAALSPRSRAATFAPGSQPVRQRSETEMCKQQ